MRAFPLLVALALLVSAAPALADPPSGGDAPDKRLMAASLAPGTYTGRIGEGNDTADWYNVTHPAGKGVRATLSIETWGHHQLVVGPDARVAWADSPNGTMGTASGTAAGPGYVHVGVAAWPSWYLVPANYTLTVEHVDLADLAITDVRVVNASLGVGDHPSPTKRRIEVDVVNLGSAEDAGSVVVTANTPTDGRRTEVGNARLLLAPGEARTVAFDWDATGTVGHVRLRAQAAARIDANASNGDVTRGHFVLVTSHVGVTAFPPPPLPASVCAPPAILVLACAYPHVRDASNASLWLVSGAGSVWVQRSNGALHGGVWTVGGTTARVDEYPTASGRHVVVCTTTFADARCTILALP